MNKNVVQISGITAVVVLILYISFNEYFKARILDIADWLMIEHTTMWGLVFMYSAAIVVVSIIIKQKRK